MNANELFSYSKARENCGKMRTKCPCDRQLEYLLLLHSLALRLLSVVIRAEHHNLIHNNNCVFV